MDVNIIMLNGNPFFEAYSQSDILGKFIFLALYTLSICSWSVLLYKVCITHQAKKHAFRFREVFQLQKLNPLSLDCETINKRKTLNPFSDLYQVLKRHCLEVLAKNRHFSKLQVQDGANAGLGQPQNTSYLSLSDIDFVASH